jgi:hypothetical protein
MDLGWRSHIAALIGPPLLEGVGCGDVNSLRSLGQGSLDKADKRMPIHNPHRVRNERKGISRKSF